jgi:RNA polymerase sigma-70 factor (ECF subfamily)
MAKVGLPALDCANGPAGGQTGAAGEPSHVPVRIHSPHTMTTSGNLDALLPQLYDELKRIAIRAMRGERSDHTLEPTALVHEAYLRLANVEGIQVGNRAQFLALASRTMRRVLVDHARARRAEKRGAQPIRVTLSEGAAVAEQQLDLLALDHALEKLEKLDSQQVRIVELRFIAGLEVEEVANILGVSPATIKRDTAMAKAWLYRELQSGPGAA